MRFIRLPVVTDRVALSASQIADLEDRGEFPRRVPISDRVVAWIEEEVDAWCAARIAVRDDPQQSAAANDLRSPPLARQRRQKRVAGPAAVGAPAPA